MHIRSGFTYGYGVAMPEKRIEAASEMEISSLALIDKDGLYSIPRFLRVSRRGRRAG